MTSVLDEVRPDGNVAELLWRAAERRPTAPAVVDLDGAGGEVSVSYGALRERVARVAAGLRGLGLQPGDRVAMLVRNAPEYVDVFLAAAAAGIVTVPLNTRLLAEEHAFMLEDSGARLLVAEPGLVADRPILAEVPDLGVVSVDGREAAGPSGLSVADLAAVEGGEGLAPIERSGDDLLSLMYTSGTTGPPKAVMLTHASWQVVTRTAVDVLGFRDGEATLHAAPLTHGSGFLLLPTLAVGGVNLLCRAFSAPRTVDLLQAGRVTGGFFVPSMVRMLLDAMPPDSPPPAALRRLFYAGSPIQLETLREAYARFGPVLVQSFGQMECPMFLTLLDAADHERALSGDRPDLARSAGRAMAGVELRIVGEDGADRPGGSAGEVVVRAPQTMAGYWNRPEASAEALDGGWLHTGDVGFLDDEGFLFLVDRRKDMIVTGGSNVYAREVEEVLLEAPGVRDAAVIGTPHRLWGEAVTAVLVPEGGDRPTGPVLEACRRRLAGYRVPKRVVWVDELPRNAYGKVLKRALRERFEKEPAWEDGE